MSEELLINVNVSGEDKLTNIDSKLEQVTQTSNKTTNAFTAMRKEVRNAKADMLSYAEGTDEYNAAMLRAAAAADKMRDMNDKIKAAQKDVGVVAKNVAGTVSGLAGAFATAEGVMGLFGVQSEDTAKAILKIQQVMSVTSGIAQFADSLDSMKDLYNAVKLNIIGMVTAKQAETVATVENAAANTAEAGAIASTGVAATVSAKAILASLGPMALVAAAVGLVVTGVMKLIEVVTKVPDEIKLDVKMDEEVSQKLATNIQKAHQFALDYNSAVRDGNKARIKELTEVGAKEFNLHKDQLKMIGDNVDTWRVAFSDYLEMAKRTYKEEILIKANAEAESNQEIGIDRMNTLIKQRKQLEKSLLNSGTKINTINQVFSNPKTMKALYALDAWHSKEAENLMNLADLQIQYNDTYESLTDLQNKKLISEMRLSNFEKNNPRPKTTQTDIVIGEDKPKKEFKLPALKKGITKEEFVPEEAPVIEKLPELKSASKEFDDVNKNIVKSEENKKEQLDLLYSKQGATIAEQLEIERKYYQKNLTEAQSNLESAKKIYNEQKQLYTDESNSLNIKIDNYNAARQQEIQINTDYKNKIAQNNQDLQNIQTEYENTKDLKTAESLQKKYSALTEEKVVNEKELKLSENRLKDLEGKKQEIDTGTKTVEEIGSKVKEAGAQVIDANQKIVDSNASLAENSKQTWANMMKNVTDYADTAKGAFDAMANLNQAEIDSNNAKYDANKEMIENSNMSEDEKTAALKKNEKERYKENLKAFEAQKKWQIASVLASSASSIAKTWEGYSSMGIPGAILAGIQTAVIAANTIAQIKTIKAQRMDAPSESSTSESASSATANVYAALTPTSNSLTSSSENLNMMSAASQKNVETVVKVSDINNVQNKVTVRDSNSSY